MLSFGPGPGRRRPRTCRLSQVNAGVSSMCWSKRPGVHTMMLVEVTTACSRESVLPPTTRPAENCGGGWVAREMRVSKDALPAEGSRGARVRGDACRTPHACSQFL